MSISVMQHELWYTVRDMRFSKSPIIIICVKLLSELLSEQFIYFFNIFFKYIY